LVRSTALMGSMIVEVAWAKQIARARFDVLQSSIPRLVLCHNGRNSHHKEGRKHSHLVAFSCTGVRIMPLLAVHIKALYVLTARQTMYNPPLISRVWP